MKLENRPNGIQLAKPHSKSDPAAIRRGVYWTCINTGGISAAAAAAFGVQARPQETPHEGLCMFACKSPTALLRALPKGKGWCPARFNHTDHKIVRVTVTRHGLSLRFFKTYQAACEAHSKATDTARPAATLKPHELQNSKQGQVGQRSR